MQEVNRNVEEAWSHRASGRCMGDIPISPRFFTDLAWEQWLWHEDPNEEAHADILMNRMQLLGLLIARFRAAYQDVHHASSSTLETILMPPGKHLNDAAKSRLRRMALFDHIPVNKLTLRQLRDSLENMQVQWVKERISETMQPRINDAVDAIFHRFGVLASQPWAQDVLDDPDSVEHRVHVGTSTASSYSNKNVVKHKNYACITRICARRFVNIFFALYRTLQLWATAKRVPNAPDSFDCGIRIHHIVASSDDFSRLSMHWDLMPAAKLNYIHDFRGYFNCISQVVYFHDPEYQRRPQEKNRIAEISAGIVNVAAPDGREVDAFALTPVHIVTPLMQLYPEIEVAHADDTGELLSRASNGKWTWVFAGHTLYLAAPPPPPSQPTADRMRIGRVRIMYHKDVAALLHAYLSETNQVNEAEGQQRRLVS
jgi:hypothetical protein